MRRETTNGTDSQGTGVDGIRREGFAGCVLRGAQAVVACAGVGQAAAAHPQARTAEHFSGESLEAALGLPATAVLWLLIVGAIILAVAIEVVASALRLRDTGYPR